MRKFCIQDLFTNRARRDVYCKESGTDFILKSSFVDLLFCFAIVSERAFLVYTTKLFPI